MSYDPKACGARIRQLRKRSGYTQEELSRKLNMDRSVLSRIETGEYVCPAGTLVELSEMFEVSLDYLISGKCSNTYFKSTERALLKEVIHTMESCLQQIKSIL